MPPNVERIHVLSVLERFFYRGGHMKRIIYVLTVSLLIAVLFGCTPKEQENVTIVDFQVSLSVKGLVDTVLTEEDFNNMLFVEKTISRTDRDGNEFIYHVKGILLKDVLSYLNVTPDAVSLEAEDGYNQSYQQDIYNDDLTILVFFNDGDKLPHEDGPIWVIAGNFTGNFWVRQLVRISLE
jgi:DMSO/TMAO reductase YedYZ molybdopterin-dependent catalytic subunit